MQFEKCHHYACLSCLNSYANQILANFQEHKSINCYDCDSPLFLTELRRIFSDDKLLLKYKKRLFEQSADIVWCPRCHHSIVCVPSESTSGNHKSFVECFHCQYTFCRRCNESWHPQIQCPKDQLIQEVKQNLNVDKPKLNKIQIDKILSEIENVEVIEKCTKPCPSCNVRIEKNGGCQHMNCRQCQIHFCWTCGWYGGSYGPHLCQVKPDKAEALLPPDMNRDIEHLLSNENEPSVKHAAMKRVQMCPRENCRQAHIKIGSNNMLKCGKCGNYFCFLCGEAIYGTFHFSQYGCLLNSRV